MVEEVGLQLPDFEESDFYVEQEQVRAVFFLFRRIQRCTYSSPNSHPAVIEKH